MFRDIVEALRVVAAFSEGRGEGCVWRASKDLIFFSGPVRRWPLPHLKRHFHTDSWTWRGKSTQGWAWRVFPSFSSTRLCVLERCVSATVNSIERVYRLFHRSSPQPSLQTLPQTGPQTLPQVIPQSSPQPSLQTLPQTVPQAIPQAVLQKVYRRLYRPGPQTKPKNDSTGSSFLIFFDFLKKKLNLLRPSRRSLHPSPQKKQQQLTTFQL